ncbi:hypothetical protein M885DRAFT_572426 [Pelagophyceae sp. CCMP2097]|nr:hypothetical protein M885DRAFT_572426 [Pelagophyceae sp. CCMP2097]
MDAFFGGSALFYSLCDSGGRKGDAKAATYSSMTEGGRAPQQRPPARGRSPPRPGGRAASASPDPRRRTPTGARAVRSTSGARAPRPARTPDTAPSPSKRAAAVAVVAAAAAAAAAARESRGAAWLRSLPAEVWDRLHFRRRRARRVAAFFCADLDDPFGMPWRRAAGLLPLRCAAAESAFDDELAALPQMALFRTTAASGDTLLLHVARHGDAAALAIIRTKLSGARFSALMRITNKQACRMSGPLRTPATGHKVETTHEVTHQRNGATTHFKDAR